MFFRIFEFSKINATIFIYHDSSTLCFIIFKLTVEYVSVGVFDPAKSLSFSILKATLITWIVEVHLAVGVVGYGLTRQRYLFDTPNEDPDDSMMLDDLCWLIFGRKLVLRVSFMRFSIGMSDWLMMEVARGWVPHSPGQMLLSSQKILLNWPLDLL